MVEIIFLLYIVSFAISLPGLFSKAGYSTLQAFIPIYNIVILMQILDIKPWFLILLGLGLIFLEHRMFIATMICLFLPFTVADAYDKGFITGILGVCFPFFIFPYIGYLSGTYRYDMED